MRALYSLLLYLLLPVVLLRLWLRGRSDPACRRHWAERLGRDLPQGRGGVWLHAVSVGEVSAAEPLLRALLARDPDRPVLVTVSTPGGRQTLQRLFGDTVQCRYLPYDLPGPARWFVASLQPDVAIFMEVELWPNLYAELAARGIALYLVNARLSERSWRGYRRFGGLTRRTLQAVSHIAAQTDNDRARFIELGAAPGAVSVTGNLKFDARLPADLESRAQRLRERWPGRQPVWVAASTHEGEEGPLLEAHAGLLKRFPQALLLLVPRHPERAGSLLRACDRQGLTGGLYSAGPVDGAAVLLVDRLGLLVYCYAAADAAFIGGSLVERGGHNPIEALLAGAAVVSGPHTTNFADIYRQLQAAGAACTVTSGESLAACLAEWFGDSQARSGAIEAGRRVVQENRGALGRIVALVDPAD